MEIWLQDFRYALRTIRKNVALSAVILISLAIGIGANSAIFSVVDALLLRPLPYSHPERLVAVWLHSPRIGIFRDWPSPGEYIDVQNQNHSFAQMAIAQSRAFTLTGTLTGREQPERVEVLRTQSSLLDMFGAKPMMGRLILPEEDKPGRAPVAVLSYGAWQRLFHSDREIVGKSIVLDGQALTVAGVLQRGFAINSEVFPSEGPMDKVDIFAPMPLGPDAAQRRGDENYNIVAQLKPSVSVKQAQADINIIADRIREKDKRDSSFGMDVIGLQEQVVGDVRRPLLVLLGSVALVLLIACANVASLLLARAAGRKKEIAIRMTLGAGWRRVTQQLMTESVLFGLLGGTAGLAVARIALSVVRSMNPGNIPRLEEIHISGAVLAFTFAISLATGILFGLAPVWRAIKIDLNSSLKSSGRGQSDGGLNIKRHRLRGVLVGFELALSVMLLIGAGLLIRSFVRLQNVPPGFTTDHVLTMQIAANDPKYRQNEDALAAFYREVESRVARLPGVTAEGEVSSLPLTGSVGWGGINVEGYHPPDNEELQVDERVASADYFHAMKIPLISGRFFNAQDTSANQKVAIIDQKFAQRFWPKGDAVGRHVWFDTKKPITIVGVVGTVKQYGLGDDGKIAVYFAEQQGSGSKVFLVARTSSEQAGLAAAITGEVHAVDAGAVVYGIRTMRDILYESLARQRFSTTMLTAFSAFALLLAAVGLYGLLAYLVSQSAHDIGIMAALGASPGKIVGLILRQGMKLTLSGIVIGIAGAAALSRVVASLLFGVSAMDPVTFVGVPAVLVIVALAAMAIPAWRAARIDPAAALREE